MLVAPEKVAAVPVEATRTRASFVATGAVRSVGAAGTAMVTLTMLVRGELGLSASVSVSVIAVVPALPVPS